MLYILIPAIQSVHNTDCDVLLLLFCFQCIFSIFLCTVTIAQTLISEFNTIMAIGKMLSVPFLLGPLTVSDQRKSMKNREKLRFVFAASLPETISWLSDLWRRLNILF